MASGKAKGAVAAGHPMTAEAGQGILSDGGNAFDAALGAMLVACLTEPVFASLGGGGYLLARPAHQQPWFYDFFPHTPRQRLDDEKRDWLTLQSDGGLTQYAGLGTMATPGAVAGVFAVHADLGRMPLRDVAARALDWAVQGVPLSGFQAHMLSLIAPSLTRQADCAALLTKPKEASVPLSPEGAPQGIDGALPIERRPLQEGELLQSWHFADALDALLIEGPDLFYKGEIGARLVRDCQFGGGHLRADDLSRYRVEGRRPLTVPYGDHRLWISPPPSLAGLQMAFALGLVNGQSLAAKGWGSAHHWGLLAESLSLTTEAYLASLSPFADVYDTALLDPKRVTDYRQRLAGKPTVRRGTTHISVIDDAGNCAALTLSNGEGAGYAIPRTGILMNNMLGAMDLPGAQYDQWERNTRMASLLAPTLAHHRDGRLIALGAGGSSRIRTSVLQVLCNVLDFALPLEEAVTRPRLHVEGCGETAVLGCERDLPDAVRRLWPRYRVWDDVHPFFGGVHAVERSERGVFTAVGDPRRHGVGLLAH